MTPALPGAVARFIAEAPIAVTLALPGDSDRALVAANPHFCRLTGYAEAEILGRDCRFLQGPATAAASRTAMRRFFDDESAAQTRVEVVNYRRDGRPFVNLVYLSKLTGVGGRLRYLFASQFDVSHASAASADAYDVDLAAGLKTLGRAWKLGVETSLTTLAASNHAIATAKLALAEIEAREP